MYVSREDLHDKFCVPTYLSQDHKPNIGDEKARIEANGGEVKRLDNDNAYRVYSKGHSYPGLAMSRAIGDLSAHSCGIIHEPEVFGLDNINEKGGYVVIASDGVWDFASPESIVKILREKKINAPEYIAQKAYKKSSKYNIKNSDDITAIVYSV